MNTDIIFQWNRLETMTAIELHNIHMARQQVFIVEQCCPYQDADAFDLVSWHLQGTINGQLVAYLRVVDAGHKYPEPSIGRVITLAEHRNKGMGVQLMQAAIDGLAQYYPKQANRMSAQAHLQQFYGRFAYQAVGEPYLEDGIEHIEMLRHAKDNSTYTTRC